jgi:hypothetical protein
MKHKGLFIATVVFLLLVNTTYYWEGKMGMFAMVTSVLMIFYFLVLAAFLISQAVSAVREKFKNRDRVTLTGFMAVVLVLCVLFPGGLVNFERFESESILIAHREGVANCTMTIKFRKDNSFVEHHICFGLDETTGAYRVAGDTIFFEDISPGRSAGERYSYATIEAHQTENQKDLGYLVMHKDYSDLTGMPLRIIKNKLTGLAAEE